MDAVTAMQRDITTTLNEFSKAIVGQNVILRKVLIALLCKGHVLLEGAPGLAKTLMVKTIAKVSGCEFNRIQFTPDLLPGDITGVETYDKDKGFYIMKGPVFSNFILADEINRASPKVQSALLEAMQEKQVTIAKETFDLPRPFMVIATQNPIESVGVYNLPEAQVDRFIFKLNVSYPSITEEESVLLQNNTLFDFSHFKIEPILSAEKIFALQNATLKVYANESIRKYIVSIINATRNPKEYDIEEGKYLDYGASPRASIGLFIAAKAHALVSGRTYVTPHDVKAIAHDVLRHRIFLNYEATVDNIDPDNVIDEILKHVPVP